MNRKSVWHDVMSPKLIGYINIKIIYYYYNNIIIIIKNNNNKIKYNIMILLDQFILEYKGNNLTNEIT